MISKRVLLHTSMLFSKHEWIQIDPPVSPRRWLHHLLDGQVFAGYAHTLERGFLKCYGRILVIVPISFMFFPFALHATLSYYIPCCFSVRVRNRLSLSNFFNRCALIFSFALSNIQIDQFHLLWNLSLLSSVSANRKSERHMFKIWLFHIQNIT